MQDAHHDPGQPAPGLAGADRSLGRCWCSMAASSLVLRLLDIIEAIEHIRGETVGVALDAFGADWRER